MEIINSLINSLTVKKLSFLSLIFCLVFAWKSDSQFITVLYFQCAIAWFICFRQAGEIQEHKKLIFDIANKIAEDHKV